MNLQYSTGKLFHSSILLKTKCFLISKWTCGLYIFNLWPLSPVSDIVKKYCVVFLYIFLLSIHLSRYRVIFFCKDIMQFSHVSSYSSIFQIGSFNRRVYWRARVKCGISTTCNGNENISNAPPTDRRRIT